MARERRLRPASEVKLRYRHRRAVLADAPDIVRMWNGLRGLPEQSFAFAREVTVPRIRRDLQRGGWRMVVNKATGVVSGFLWFNDVSIDGVGTVTDIVCSAPDPELPLLTRRRILLENVVFFSRRGISDSDNKYCTATMQRGGEKSSRFFKRFEEERAVKVTALSTTLVDGKWRESSWEYRFNYRRSLEHAMKRLLEVQAEER